VVARNESGPRYGCRYHARALREEGSCVLESFGGGLRDRGRDLDAAFRLAVGDLKVEGLEDLALDLHRCGPIRAAISPLADIG